MYFCLLKLVKNAIKVVRRSFYGLTFAFSNSNTLKIYIELDISEAV